MTARTPGPRAPLAVAVDDPKIDRVLREHRQLLVDQTKQVMAGAKIIEDVVLPVSVDTVVSHRLGRPPRFVQVSCARGPIGLTGGQVVEVLDASSSSASVDRSNFVVLRAVGYGFDITVDLLVM